MAANVWRFQFFFVTLHPRIEKQYNMATIVLQVPDESLVSKIRQACKMLLGVTSVKVQRTRRYEAKPLDVTQTAGFKEAMDDVKHGRVTQYNSVDDLFKELAIEV